MSKIRPKAVCLFRYEGKILLAEVFAEGGEYFLVPIGGGVEFGEYSKDAAVRETLEEISAHAINIRLLDVIENMFSHDGQLSHEIVFVYEGDLEDQSLYEKDEIQGDENGVPFMARWYDVPWLKEGHVPFYPEGILEML